MRNLIKFGKNDLFILKDRKFEKHMCIMYFYVTNGPLLMF